ncbi:Uncharacterised protein [uncultured Clostridium sp.]|nr:Uncharacterised protein [uncultured Clostridium sp.]
MCLKIQYLVKKSLYITIYFSFFFTIIIINLYFSNNKSENEYKLFWILLILGIIVIIQVVACKRYIYSLMKSLFTNEFYNKEVYINIENGNIISIFSNTVKIKTKLGLNSKLINYKNIFIFIIDLRTVLVIPNRVLENLQDKEQFFKVLNNS